MARLRVAAFCFVALVILIGFPGRSLSASAPAGLVEAAARVETVSISVGDRELDTSARHRAYDPRAGWTIDRGTVVERLIPRGKGVEQTWTFAHRPVGEGDLVVRVAAPGSEYVGADESGLTFRDARTGHEWNYGHGTWIDADGRRMAVQARWVGGAIELRVPAEIVARSAYPAVLDPFVGQETEILPSNYMNTPSGLNVAIGDPYSLVVWDDTWDVYSGVYALRINYVGEAIDPSPIPIATDSVNNQDPVVRWVGNFWLVFWRRGSSICVTKILPDGTTPDPAYQMPRVSLFSVKSYAAQCSSERCLVLASAKVLTMYSAIYYVFDISQMTCIASDQIVPIQREDVDFVSVSLLGENFLLAWHAFCSSVWFIEAQLVDSNGQMIGDRLDFGIYSLFGDQASPLSGTNYKGDNYIAWILDSSWFAGIKLVEISDTGEVVEGSNKFIDYGDISSPRLRISNFRGDLDLEYRSYGTVYIPYSRPDVDLYEPRDKLQSVASVETGIIEYGSDSIEDLRYYVYFDPDAMNGTSGPALVGRAVINYFSNRKVSRSADGNVLIDWSVDNRVANASGVNIYRSTAFDESYAQINISTLPMEGTYLDESDRKDIGMFYWLEVVDGKGPFRRDGRDRLWIKPVDIESTYVLYVRESTIASTPAGTSTFDVQVLSQKGYAGTVTLGVTGLGPEAVAWSFDNPSVEVPGRATLTVEWDPALTPPDGGYEYPFEITATDAASAQAVIHTVDVLGVVIDADDHYLTQFVYPAEPTAGHEAEVFGRLAPPESGETVTVTTGSTLDVFTATTDDTGFFSLTVPVDAAGTIEFTSSVAEASAAPYTTDAARGRRQIRLTATTADGEIDPADLVAIDGEIDPNPGTGEIYLVIENPDETTAFEGTVTVDDYGTFHQTFVAQEGVTEVEVEYAGDADYYNASARLNIPADAPIGMAIVVAGGGETDNPLWDATGNLCDRAYNVYKGRLIPEERIRYLHPDAGRDPDSDGTPEVEAAPTRANLQAAIETWASGLVDVTTTWAPYKTPLTIYLAATEDAPGVLRLNETETVSAAELDGWLDVYLASAQDRYPDPCDPQQENCPPESIPVNVVLELEDSGAFVSELGDTNRIVVTSTGDGSPQWLGANIVSPDGDIAFSKFFYDEIDQGRYIATAWTAGRIGIWSQENWFYNQFPLIDANGNGVPNEEADQINGDGAGDKVLEYRNTYERRPMIDAMFSGMTLPEGQSDGLLWAKILDFGEFIQRVKCVILPPDDSGEPVREYPMRWNGDRSRWELHHDGFRHRGLYKILITAVDEDEDAALPWGSLVDVSGDTLGEDTTPPGGT